MLRNAASFLPADEFYLPRGLNGVRFTTLRLSPVDERVVPPGLAELKQLHKQLQTSYPVCRELEAVVRRRGNCIRQLERKLAQLSTRFTTIILQS